MGKYIDGFNYRAPKSQGKDCIYVLVIDLLNMVIFVISIEFKAPQVGKLFFKEAFELQETPKNIVNDRDSWFLKLFWQELFHVIGIKLSPRTKYHPQIDGQTKIVNKWIEGYLQSYVAGHQIAWIK